MDTLSSGYTIDDAHLYAYAASTARLLQPLGDGSGQDTLRRLRRHRDQIRQCYEAVRRRYGDLPSPPAACEWLLDNWYMVQREYAVAAEAFRPARRLRRCRDGILIEELALALVRAGGGRVTEARCRLFLDGFQSVTVLRRGELTRFPAAVRAALLREMAGVCQSMQYAADTAPHSRALEALFGSLRLFSVLDMEALLTGADVTNGILCADPSGDYPHMDRQTRQDYLLRVEKLAYRAGMEEHSYARRLVRQAKAEGKHLGFYLFSDPRPVRARLYIAANVLLSLFLSLLPAFAFHSVLAALLLLLPVSELVKSLLDYVLLRLVSPRRLPRMDLEKGVPPEGKTLCVLSTLLTDAGSARALCARLEELRYACRREGKKLLFGLLADLPGADTEQAPGDAEILEAARQAVDDLNRRLGGGFVLLTRKRSFDGESWTGWERKRGALLELAKLLCEKPTSLHAEGDAAALAGTRFLLTLDSDTRLYPGAAGELIGAMLHPLVRPRIDGRTGLVTQGHGIIHPRIATDLASANATDFALIFAGAGGSDPYGSLCGELYMDAFASGGFAGKGLLDARALLRCTEGRIPAGRVLSHDALEGACLRGAFLGDAEFSDAFPSRPLAYYRRMHRWVRGDWQNLPWVFCRDFQAMDRWRLFDSLRRSLLPPMTLFAILAGFFLPGAGLAVSAWAALLALLSRLLLCLADSGTRPRQRVRLRRYTRLLTGVGGAIVQSFLRLWLLPYEAWICLSAAISALWRMTVSHRRLLQWQTAAQAEQGSGGLAAHLRAMWPSMLLGLLLLFFSPVIIGRSAGLLWLLSPLTAAALALPARRDQPLSAGDRAYLRAAAEQTFRYYTSFCTRQDHYLPPDNFQEQPPVGPAHRTSPTNIGMALASYVAAADMGFLPWEEALAAVERTLDTLEKLPRCLGHFYNWYDTRSLQPLHPPFVSTVDSGNLYAALLTVRAAAAEAGAQALVRRLDALMAPMDFAPLYDRERGLFHICLDGESRKGAGGWYDLLASEAMLTSYLAIAKGDVPVKHWRRLSRAQLQKDGYRGLASWTGTMFEYLMTELFLPLYQGSLLRESSRFCLYVQKRRVFPGRPWGISESAFFSLDPSRCYRYKAHGCGALALKRGQDAELVVSPYSSFLALAVDPQSAVRNLRRLERFGARGRFGFWEALDFTPSRCRREQGEPVRCYMAHHVGMSLLAAANALCDGSIRRRFLAAAPMRACQLLLQERLPDSAVVIRRDSSPAPEKPPRPLSRRWQLRGGGQVEERLCLMSNGVYHLLAGSGGRCAAFCDDLAVYGSLRPEADSEGLGLFLTKEAQPRTAFLPAAPQSWELTEDEALWHWEGDGVLLTVRAFTAGGELGEGRSITVQSAGGGRYSLQLRLPPLLTAYSRYADHPAYWQLGLASETVEDGMVLRRLRRGEQRELWLCVLCDMPGDWRFRDACLRGRFPLTLKPGEERSLRLSLCLGSTRNEAMEGAQRLLYAGDRGCMVSAAAARLGLDSEHIGAAMALLPALLRPVSGAAPRRELWPYGVSGDLPLLCCDERAVESLPLLRSFCLLKSCGIHADLVYLSGETGEYRRPGLRKIGEALARWGLEALLESPGGVHFVPAEAADTVQSRASLCVGQPDRLWRPLTVPPLSQGRRAGAVPPFAWEDDAFCFAVRDNLPGRAWQMLLTNGSLGCILTECGPAALWLENAREMRLLPPQTDLRATGGSEAVWVEAGGRVYSLFAANDGCPCRVRYAPGQVSWEKELPSLRLRTVCFLCPDTNVRILRVEGAEGLTLHWAIRPLLGAPDASSLRLRFQDGVLQAENPEAYLPNRPFLATASCPCDGETDFAPAGAHLRVPARKLTLLLCGCCSREELAALCAEDRAQAALAESLGAWRGLLDRFSLRSGFAPLDHYMNTWAPYQALACRLLGRSSLYQSGGAFGFRDQLQDAVNLLLLNPALARERIEDCCRHQYVEGDVMHWWHVHPDGDRGVRTRCGDDLLWLPWALCEYVETTGDLAFCRRETAYISSPVLTEEERDRYEQPQLSAASADLLFHAKAALDCCITRGFGPHGLPWFGSGDWNDGLDAVDGESVWLGWFFSCCAHRFAALLDQLGKPQAHRYRDYARQVGLAADEAWNGRWFRRGYWADGSPLGGDERIDSLAQSWAAFCPYADPGRVELALDAALRRLVDEERRIVRLFDPPFDADERYPGYLAGYGPGVRENGGQYTHGAIWLAMACFAQKRPEDGWRILRLLLPETHDAAVYQAEPFVLPADVSAAPGQEGRAGWTWYTGSAGWYFRVVSQAMLGLRLRYGALHLSPQLPGELSSCSVRCAPLGQDEQQLTISNGQPQP